MSPASSIALLALFPRSNRRIAVTAPTRHQPGTNRQRRTTALHALQRELIMPVAHFRIKWPDGAEADCYSPSTVVKDFLTPGVHYPLNDFLKRSREALHIGSERVREKYGFACSAAMDQLAQIEREALRFADIPDAEVTVLAFS